MKSLYDNVSLQASKLVTSTYSTSFSFGIRILNNRLRNAVYSIYGFVRVADEIVDSFDGYDKQKLMNKFRQDTFEALENRISTNPIINSFQDVVHRYEIGYDLIDTFLKSMEMDLHKMDYDPEKYDQYILGSSEVVGLMCLHVFTENNKQLYNELKPFAMKLGAAFQKVNFLRDMKDDYYRLGRIYFPNVDMSNFNPDSKTQIENEIEEDFRVALKGIRKLPVSSKGGVYLAYIYYRSLFKKIKKLSPQNILNERVRINNGHKLGLLFNTLVQNKLNLI